MGGGSNMSSGCGQGIKAGAQHFERNHIFKDVVGFHKEQCQHDVLMDFLGIYGPVLIEFRGATKVSSANQVRVPQRRFRPAWVANIITRFFLDMLILFPSRKKSHHW